MPDLAKLDIGIHSVASLLQRYLQIISEFSLKGHTLSVIHPDGINLSNNVTKQMLVCVGTSTTLGTWMVY